ncbi:M24 family metallopeptidase [Anaerotardibacter muris]|uniref:M24 family metallopeptidase n=1 Tax=Anaerotardibacter muris TaxID=2941505 RepID=UPI0020417FD4|nr:Xaa-Pro peptidase family protein [Anaerotardibacter muris]
MTADTARYEGASTPCEQRLACVRDVLAQAGIDALYVRDLSNIKWLTGFDAVFDDEPAHALVITDKDAWLHTDSRYCEAAQAAAGHGPIEVSTAPGGHAAFLLSKIGSAARVAFEDTLTLREFHQLERVAQEAQEAKEAEGGSTHIELVEQSGLLERLRQTKAPSEIDAMRKAQRITDDAFSYIISFIKPGMSEAQIQQALDAFMFEAGAEGLAFPTIVATGSHAASPHAIPGDRTIQPGDAIVMDFGARYNGYCSDMTRTVFVGEPNEKMRAAWEAIREANERCEEALRAGKTGAQIHELAESILAQHGFAKTMGHGLGHSLGIDIHEDPSLSPRNGDPLPVGAVVTVEPGIYIPGEFGMRLEDFGVITESGFQVLTQSTHDMVIIDPR